MRSFLSLLCLVPLTFGAEIASREQPQSAREDKFLSVFQIVKFNNEMCSASNGNMGVCYTEAECTAKGGVSSGSCAQQYGVCCVFTANTCGSTVAQAVSYIESPNYPNPAPMGSCMFNVGKCDAGVCQYKIQFEDVMLADPMMGTCSNDTLTITNLDPVSTAVVPTNLCGTLSGQEIYVSVNTTTTDPKFNFNIASMVAKWRIKVTQLRCTDTQALAPPGCLTYNTGMSGTIMSFNNQNGNGEMLNDHKYSHCIMNQAGFCDVSLSSSNFALGSDGMLGFGTMVASGNTFGTMGSLLYNFTGPYVIPFMSGSSNVAMNAGYSISYLLLPC